MLLNQMENRDGMNLHISGNCVLCKKQQTIVVDAKSYLRYCNGTALIQEALPMLSAGQREMLISGTCPECFDNLCAEIDNVRK